MGAIHLSSDESVLYVGGGGTANFNRIGVTGNILTRYNIAGIDTSTFSVNSWGSTAQSGSGNIYDIDSYGSGSSEIIYIVGYYGATFPGNSRSNAMALTAAGVLTNWAPNIMHTYRVVVNHTTSEVYLAGSFTQVNSTEMKYFAVVDTANGTLNTSFDFKLDERPTQFVFGSGNKVIMAGFFELYDSVVRQNVFQFDLTTNQLMSWGENFDFSGDVYDMYTDSYKLYIFGDFWLIDDGSGNQREWIASFDTSNGALNSIGSGIDCNAFDCADGFTSVEYYPSRGTFLLGGIGRGITEFDPVLNQITSFDPFGATYVDDKVTLAIKDDVIYVAGELDGTQHHEIKAFSLLNGAATGWQVETGGTSYEHISEIDIVDNALLVVGSFTTINSDSRNHVAVVDLYTGATLPWDINLDVSDQTEVDTAYYSDGVLFIAGSFTSVNGIARNGIAAIDYVTETLLDWNPSVYYYYWETSTLWDNFSEISFISNKLFIAGDMLAGEGANLRGQLLSFSIELPLSYLEVSSIDNPVEINTDLSITVRAEDVDHNTLTSYRGSVSFSSNSSGATLPGNYTFTESDSGVHEFTGIQFDEIGIHTITVTDLVSGTITGNYQIQVIQTKTYDLDNSDNFDYRIDGPEADFCYGCWDTGYAVGDINADGIEDLAVLGYENGGNDDKVFVVFGGNNQRPKITNFSETTAYNIKINLDLINDLYVSGVFIEDINGDGKKDLVISHNYSNVGGNGRGAMIVFYSTLLDDYSASTGNALSVENSNDFNLRFQGSEDLEYLSGYEGAVLVADYDNDGRKDLFLGTYSGDIYVFNADEIATFSNTRGTLIDLSDTSKYSFKLTTSGNSYIGYNLSNEDKNLVVDDLNGDGQVDMAISDSLSGNTTDGVYFIDSSITQAWATNGVSIDIFQSSNYTAHITDSTKGQYNDYTIMQTGDINGDNKHDLIVDIKQSTSPGPVVLFSTKLATLVGTGNSLDLSVGTSYNVKINLTNQSRSVFPISVGNDWNDDGFNDLVIHDSLGQVYFFFSNLFSALGTSTNNSWNLPGATYSVKLHSSVLNESLKISEAYKPIDFDGDNIKDIIIVSSGGNHSHNGNNSSYVVKGKKLKNAHASQDLDLSNSNNYHRRFDTPEGADSMYNGMNNVGDFDGDQVDDLFIINDSTSYNGAYSGSAYVILGEVIQPPTPTYTIQNLPSPMSPRLLSDNSVDLSVTGQNGAVQTRLFSSAIPLADTTVDLTQNRNWSGVNSSIDLSGRKLLITGLTTAPGASATFSMYIPKDAADDKLHVCPGATNLTEITITCNGGYDLTTSSPGVTIFTYLSNTYWKVENSEGLGSVSYKYVESGGGNNNGGDNNNGEENNGGGNNNVNTGDTGTDTDNDGVSDENEVENGTNPQTPDTDSDGLKDGEEVDGCVYTEGSTECGTIIFIPTDPTSPDTDGEGLKDGEEVLGCKFEAGVTECSDVTFPPTNPNETDTDSDGLTDHKEVEIGTNPTDDDTDSDGISDGEEVYGCIYKDDSTECSEITYDPTNPKDPNSFYIPPTDENGGVPTTGANQEDISSSEGIIASVLSSVQTAAKSGVLPGISVVAAVSAAALTTLAFPNIPLFVILLLRRRNKYAPWGLVSDEINSTPIPFATVRVFNNKGEFVTQEITDLNGKYTGVVNPGTYKLEVKSGGYEASTLGIVLTNDVLNKDIVLSPVGSNGFHYKKFLRANLKLINRLLFYLGLTLATLTLIFAFSLLNLVIFLAFVAEAILFFFIGRSRAGVVYDTSTGDHLKGVFLTVTDMNGNQIGTTVSDKKGKYSALLQKGTYQLKVYLDNFTLGDKDVSGRDAKGNPFKSVNIKESGILNQEIALKKESTATNESNSGFTSFQGR